MPEFQYQPLFDLGPDETEYRHLGHESAHNVQLEL